MSIQEFISHISLEDIEKIRELKLAELNHIPTLETEQVLNQLKNKDGKSFENVDELFSDLNNQVPTISLEKLLENLENISLKIYLIIEKFLKNSCQNLTFQILNPPI